MWPITHYRLIIVFFLSFLITEIVSIILNIEIAIDLSSSFYKLYNSSPLDLYD